MSLSLSERAPAKVNLTLQVTGRRADGYHLLDSLVVFGPAADVLHAIGAPELSLDIQGPFAPGLRVQPSNLVLRAARALEALAGRSVGAALVLEKNLPIASGIGGGSADAAATLRLLCRLWDMQPTRKALDTIALSLGADVPVCLESRPARMTGIGEVLSPIPELPRCGLLLTNPGIEVSTADVFRARTGPYSSSPHQTPAWPTATSMAAALAELGNDLERPALAVAPAIGPVLAVLRSLPNCLHAQMSGSGATCFALFNEPGEAQFGATMLPSAWWRSSGLLPNGRERPY